MNKISFLILLLMSNSGAFAQTERYVRGYFETINCTMEDMDRSGIDMEGVTKQGEGYVAELSESEWAYVVANSCEAYVIEYDLAVWYRNRLNGAASKKTSVEGQYITADFNYGSMGGYLTLGEVYAELDSMIIAFPSLITPKQTIGYSIEGRPIFALKISDNPTIDEGETEVLYTAMHHAREPMSVHQLIYFMQYLLHNYTTDDTLNCLINDREMWFIPMLNPDGYAYNYLMDPAGGGMWRKNRRDNMDGTFGVDLNRNYGYLWAYDDAGSSFNTTDQTYRGTSAFSEPETQAIRDFCNNHSFVSCLNYHSFSDVLIYPWGYDYGIYTPDSAAFVQVASVLTSVNGYSFGTGDQTIGYIVNGDSDDWMYGEQTTKNKMYAMTPEVGSVEDGFWPTIDRILPLADNSVWANIGHAWCAKSYITLAPNFTDFTTSNHTDNVPLTVINYGVQPTTITISASSASPYFVPKADTTIAIAATQTLSLAYLVANATATPSLTSIPFTITYSYDCFQANIDIDMQYLNNTAGLAEQKIEFNVYPNPTSNILVLPSMYNNAKASIYSTSSGYIATATVENNQLPIAELACGVYYLKIINGTSVSRAAFVVMR